MLENLVENRLNRVLLEQIPGIAFLLRPATREIVAANQAAIQAGAVPGRTCFAAWRKRETPCPWCAAADLWRTGEPQHLEFTADSAVWDARWLPVAPDLFLHYACNITAQKQTESSTRVSLRFLEIIRAHTEIKPLLDEIVKEIKLFTGCEAVGIRVLDAAGGIPYLAYRGFSRHFYELESPLSIRSDECMCINVIKGDYDPRLPFYTPGGSFYMNGTSRFLATVSEKDKGRTRNVCNLEGYESVALIPIHRGERILGLIHVADRREDMVPLHLVETLEQAGMQLGPAFLRVQAEEALRESEELYRSLFENMLNGFAFCKMLFDQEGEPADFLYLKVNDSFEALTGLKEVTGKKVSQVIPGLRESDPELFAIYSRVALTGKPERFEIYVKALQMWFAVSVYSPKKEYFVAVFDVITERKQAEEALRQSERTLRGLLDANPESFLLIDNSLTVITANKTAAQRFGKSLDELIGVRLYDLFPPEVLHVRRPYLDRVLQTGRPARFEDTRDGIHFYTSAQPVLDETGKVSRVAILGIDVTGYKRMEAERERLASAIEQAADMVVMTDAAGDIQYVNPAFEAVTGYRRDEVLGRTPRFLMDPEWSETLSRSIWEVLTRGKTWVGCFIGRKKEGGCYTVEASISPVRDAAGAIVNYVGVLHDITEHLQLYEEKSKMESQLRQAQKLESVGRLAGGVAHDFNNMLGVILGYTEIALLQFQEQDPIYQDLKEVRQAAQRSAGLVRQLLAFARLQAVSPKEMDLNDALSGMLKMLRRLIGEDIDLVWMPGHDLWQVMMDPSQIDQVLANLMVNARDAITGVGRVVIETDKVVLDEAYCAEHAECAPGEYVGLTVSDNGCGMDKETLAKIFDPFFTTKEPGKGTGLGLATVYGIIKQNRGQINVYSEPGRGTTFKILLPRHRAAAAAPEKIAAAPLQRGTETVLVVEDEEMILRLDQGLLESLGYTVLTAQAPAEALELAREHPGEIGLLMTDVVLPKMNGLELARRFSSLRPGVKILFMSGYTADVIAPQEGLNPGAPFLQKPFTLKSLAEKVRQALAGEAAV